jgi:siroheme synthase
MSKSEAKMGKFIWLAPGQVISVLVTLRAKECIENADVIVYDHLANPDARLGTGRRRRSFMPGNNPVKAGRSRKSLRC